MTCPLHFFSNMSISEFDEMQVLPLSTLMTKYHETQCQEQDENVWNLYSQ